MHIEPLQLLHSQYSDVNYIVLMTMHLYKLDKIR
jgi:hypothetical protein